MQDNKTVAPESVTEEEQLIEQARIRREKLSKLVGEGKNPYEQVKYPVDSDSETIKNNFEAGVSVSACLLRHLFVQIRTYQINLIVRPVQTSIG